jgi:hypothetical protein
MHIIEKTVIMLHIFSKHINKEYNRPGNRTPGPHKSLCFSEILSNFHSLLPLSLRKAIQMVFGYDASKLVILDIVMKSKCPTDNPVHSQSSICYVV